MFMTSSSNRESIQIQPLILIDKKIIIKRQWNSKLFAYISIALMSLEYK